MDSCLTFSHIEFTLIFDQKSTLHDKSLRTSLKHIFEIEKILMSLNSLWNIILHFAILVLNSGKILIKKQQNCCTNAVFVKCCY